MAAAISINGLCKTYRRGWRKTPVVAVKDVSLVVEPGEAFGFIGPNGAGKSTTIKILTGVIRASAGSATLFGVPIERPESRQGLGYVPENPYLFDYLTPAETLRMALALHRVTVDDPDAHCRRWLERLELGHVAHQRIRSFSKGMTQRVALAQALAIRPRLLVLDEPLSGLDPVGRRDVVEILGEYKQQGGTLFFTSHVLHDVERLAGRFGLIHRGELRAVRSPAELAGADDLVLVRSIGTGEVAGMRSEFGGRWYAEVPRSELWPLLDAIRAVGHTVIEVRPTLSLENAFLRAIGEP